MLACVHDVSTCCRSGPELEGTGVVTALRARVAAALRARIAAAGALLRRRLGHVGVPSATRRLAFCCLPTGRFRRNY